MIPHNKPTLGNREILAVQRVIESSWVAQGREVASFEEELCDFFGLPDEHVVVVSSGTAALFLALWTLDSKGARIGMPVYTCSALRNAVEMVGAKPVYFDCAKWSPNLDMTTAQLSEIDVLIAPSMFGLPVAVNNNKGYKIIEDIAQAFGAKEHGKLIGLRGELGICSFYATKLITTGGQGGAIISKDKSLIDRIRNYREFDNRRDNQIRFNFQMTDIQAAVGREQLQQISEFNESRDYIFKAYKDAGLSMLDSESDTYSPVRYRAVLKTDCPIQIIKELNKIGVKAIVPIERDELLSSSVNYKNANLLANKTVSLPIYPSLDYSVVNKISNCISNL
jgi:perosamine synthetase